MKYLVEVSCPNNWANSWSATFRSLEEAQTYAHHIAETSPPKGEADYMQVEIWVFVEQVN